MGHNKLTDLERRAGRCENYWKLCPQRQWEEDKYSGILDWDGTEEWLDKHGK